MAYKSWKPKSSGGNTNYIDSKGVVYNRSILKDKLDHSGSFAKLGLTSNSWKPPGINNSYPVLFDQFNTNNSNVFSYNSSTGRIKILSNKIKCVNVETHLRINQNAGDMYAYIVSSDYDVMLGDTGGSLRGITNRNISCNIPVQQGSEIYIRVYSTNNDCAIIGASYAWAGVTVIAY